MRFKVALTNPSQHPPDDEARALLAACDAELAAADCVTAAEVLALCADADVVMTGAARLDAATIRQLIRCRAIVRLGSGYDNIDLNAGVPVANVPEFCTEEVADHTLALLLALERKLTAGDQLLRAGTWNPLHQMPARSLRGKVLGLVGFGRIAQAVAHRAEAFGINHLHFDPVSQASVGFEDLLANSDFVSLHAPLTKKTRGMIALAELRRMKRSSVLINCARGELVIESDLIRALQDGVIAGAALDVFETEPVDPGNPLLGMSQVVLSPHCAAHTVEALTNLRHQAYAEAARVLRGEPLCHRVNG